MFMVLAPENKTKMVSDSQRQSPLTLGLLWITMATGFPTVSLGFAWHSNGFSLTQVAVGIVLGCLLLLAYAIPASYFGASSGQTYGQLSRRVFPLGEEYS
jgi:purine-cytosine permease-like protein